jgi:hypothetical protein
MTAEEQNEKLLVHLHHLQEELERCKAAAHLGPHTSDDLFYREVIGDLKRRLEEANKRAASAEPLREENTLLLLQLHEAQEKLEQALWDKMMAETATGTVGAHAAEARAQLQEVQKQAPHRHLHFSIKGVAMGEAGLRDLDVRLVEHHGKAGLVFFPPEDQADNPFANWPADGEEGGRKYILFFPGQKSSAAALRAAKASGVLAIESSIAAIQQSLRADENFQISRNLTPPEIEFWHLAAQKVHGLFEGSDLRLHYDDVRCKQIAKPPASVKFTLVNPLHAGRNYDRFAVVWPGALGSGASLRQLTFINAPGNAPVFESWPLGDNGLPLREWTITLNDALPAVFRRMTRGDRVLLDRILEELPNFLHHYNGQNGAQPADLPRLRASVRKMRRRWRNLGHMHSLGLSLLGR